MHVLCARSASTSSVLRENVATACLSQWYGNVVYAERGLICVSAGHVCVYARCSGRYSTLSTTTTILTRAEVDMILVADLLSY